MNVLLLLLILAGLSWIGVEAVILPWLIHSRRVSVERWIVAAAGALAALALVTVATRYELSLFEFASAALLGSLVYIALIRVFALYRSRWLEPATTEQILS